jgi:hypothetical protein
MNVGALNHNLNTSWVSSGQGVSRGAAVKSTLCFQVHDAEDFSGALQDAVDLNKSSVATLGEAHQTYTRMKASGESPRKYMEQTVGGLTNSWTQYVKNHSQHSLQVASALAAQASSVLGPVIMAGFIEGENGTLEIELRRQTSRELIISSSNELSHLTGDHYSSHVPQGIRGGQVQVNQPLFDETPLGYLLVDTSRGFACVCAAS